MAPNLDNEDFIVVNDGLPRSGLESIDALSSPAGASNTPRADKDGKAARRRSGRSSDVLERLRALPEVRPIPWYEGKELTPDKSINSERVQTRGACLMVSRGKVNDPPCNHCQTGVGRFSKCVSLDDYFHGACATCQLATRGNLCSLRPKETLRIKSEGETRQEEADALQAIPNKQNTSTPRDKPSIAPRPYETMPTHTRSHNGTPQEKTMTAPQPPEPAHTRSQNRIQQNSPAVAPRQRSESSWTPVEYAKPTTLKRKRDSQKDRKESLQGTDVWRPYVSPYRPIAPSESPTIIQSPYGYPQPNTNGFVPVNAPPSDPTIGLNQIYKRDNPPNGIKPHPINTQVQVQQMISQVNGPPRAELRDAGGTVQQAAEPPITNTMDRDATESLSPSAQLLHYQELLSPEAEEELTDNVEALAEIPKPRATPKSNARKPRAELKPKPKSPADTPLIDTLPRKKQKQIYGIIGGLQSGIRSCQQQAESMQKQLDMLQASLGIDTEDDKELNAVS